MLAVGIACIVMSRFAGWDDDYSPILTFLTLELLVLAPAAAIVGLHHMRHDPPDLIYSTSPPASAHLLGLFLHDHTGVPWVADFRDLWTDDYQYHEPSKRRRHAHRQLEQEIVEAADVVVGVTDRQTEILARRVPHARHKFVTITNGFDEDDFPDGADYQARIDPDRRDRRAGFVLAYVGRFDHWRTSEALLAGLERFVSMLGSGRDRFTFRVVGHANSDVRRRLDTTGVQCVFTGYVSHREAIKEMRSADALLLNIPDGLNADSVITGKVFEYLAAQRPILVVGPQGSAGETLVRANEAGLTVNFDAGAVTEALERIFRAWKAGMPLAGCTRARAEPFSAAMDFSKKARSACRLFAWQNSASLRYRATGSTRMAQQILAWHFGHSHRGWLSASAM